MMWKIQQSYIPTSMMLKVYGFFRISMIEYAVFEECFYDIGKVYVDFSQFIRMLRK
jgi:hypothetical protein